MTPDEIISDAIKALNILRSIGYEKELPETTVKILKEIALDIVDLIEEIDPSLINE